MAWSQPLYQMSPQSLSKSKPQKNRSVLATGPPVKMHVERAIGIRDEKWQTVLAASDDNSLKLSPLA